MIRIVNGHRYFEIYFLKLRIIIFIYTQKKSLQPRLDAKFVEFLIPFFQKFTDLYLLFNNECKQFFVVCFTKMLSEFILYDFMSTKYMKASSRSRTKGSFSCDPWNFLLSSDTKINGLDLKKYPKSIFRNTINTM